MTRTIFTEILYKRSYKTKMAYFRVYQTKIKDRSQFCRSYVFSWRLGYPLPALHLLMSGEPSYFYKSKEDLDKDLKINDVNKHCQKTLWEF